MGIFKNMVGNIPGGNILVGNSPGVGGNSSGGSLMGGNFSGGSFADTYWNNLKLNYLIFTSFCKYLLMIDVHSLHPELKKIYKCINNSWKSNNLVSSYFKVLQRGNFCSWCLCELLLNVFGKCFVKTFWETGL